MDRVGTHLETKYSGLKIGSILRACICDILSRYMYRVRVSYGDNQNLNWVVYIIIIYFWIKSMRMEPCVVKVEI